MERKRNIVPAIPQISYEQGVNETTPYVIQLNGERFGQLLREEFGLTEDEIAKTTIYVSAQGQTPILAATHNDGKDGKGLKPASTIYMGTFWNFFNDLRLPLAIRAFPQPDPDIWQQIQKSQLQLAINMCIHVGMLRSGRWSKYADNVSPERAIPFFEKMLYRAINRQITGTIVHESQHLKDRFLAIRNLDQSGLQEKVSLAFLAAGLTWGIGATINLFNSNQEIDKSIFSFVLSPLSCITALLLLRMCGKKLDETKFIMDTMEQRAELARINISVSKWRDLVNFSSNPKYTN